MLHQGREPVIYWFAPEVKPEAKFELTPGSRPCDDTRGPLPVLRLAGR